MKNLKKMNYTKPKIIVKCLCGKEIFSYLEEFSQLEITRLVNRLLKNKDFGVWKRWYKKKYHQFDGFEQFFLCNDCLKKSWKRLKAESHVDYYKKLQKKLVKKNLKC